MFDAAVEAVVRYGYAGATTKRIAEIAGIGEATLFRRYGTKETLLREALRAEATAFSNEAVEYTGNLRADLTRVVSGYQVVLQHRGRLALSVLAELSRRPELGEIMEAPMAAMGTVAALIGRYQAEGELAGRAPWEVIVSLLSPILFSGVLRQLQPALPPTYDVESHVEQFLVGWASSR